jgi:hypothetical protein
MDKAWLSKHEFLANYREVKYRGGHSNGGYEEETRCDIRF